VLATVTVQRSKSAQTPKQKPVQKKPETFVDDDVFAPTVLRSKSLRGAAETELRIPEPLRQTIYDMTTPKSERIRRNLSDRVPMIFFVN
jgi:hypothetical protein